FLKFAGRRDPVRLHVIEQALAVPMKRFERKMVSFLPKEQMLAVIDAPTDTWVGERDWLMLMLLFNTGARVSEIISARVAEVVLGPTSSIRLHGKGRKQRSLPLWKTTAKRMLDWLHLNQELKADAPLLPANSTSGPSTLMPRNRVCGVDGAGECVCLLPQPVCAARRRRPRGG